MNALLSLKYHNNNQRTGFRNKRKRHREPWRDAFRCNRNQASFSASSDLQGTHSAQKHDQRDRFALKAAWGSRKEHLWTSADRNNQPHNRKTVRGLSDQQPDAERLTDSLFMVWMNERELMRESEWRPSPLHCDLKTESWTTGAPSSHVIIKAAATLHTATFNKNTHRNQHIQPHSSSVHWKKHQ